MAMLEATEDGSDSRSAPSRAEESPAASKPSVDDRLVYKLVKVHNSLFDSLNFGILFSSHFMSIFYRDGLYLHMRRAQGRPNFSVGVVSRMVRIGIHGLQ